MHTHSSALSGHAHSCPVRYDDILLRQIVEVELDVWRQRKTGAIPIFNPDTVDAILKAIQPQIEKELCIHHFVPNHLIAMIHVSIQSMLVS